MTAKEQDQLINESLVNDRLVIMASEGDVEYKTIDNEIKVCLTPKGAWKALALSSS